MRNFKTITTKLVGLILIASMTLSIASCDKFSSGPNADDVLDVVANYIDLLKGGKYSKAAKLTKSGDDLISDMKLDDESQEFLDKIIATSEYEIEYVDGTKNESANCTLDLTVVDGDDAIDIGAECITLGNRILRTETAGLAVLSIIMFSIDE